MTSKQKRQDVEGFIEDWAPDLAALLHAAWPHLRYVGPRVIDENPGLLLTAARTPAARYPAPLNTFLYLSPVGLGYFYRDDLIAYARFNAGLRSLNTFCSPFEVDITGGSQLDARTKMISLDARIDPHPR
jgi:hypothetical protein